MRKTRNSLGFTMAEMLIVVAIILVLAGVAFIAVQNHQRSMAQLERNTIAKELFIAAQNHLTMAESEGYPVEKAGGNFFGTLASDTTESNDSKNDSSTPPSEDSPATDAGKKPTNVYYVVGPASGNILDLMLPFGSIDETVRAGGSYLIRYQTNPAIVLDVFYVTKSGSPDRFNKDGGIGSDTYTTLMEKWNSNRDSGYVLGYYGGEEALASGEIILAPTVEIHNEERLYVTVKDNNIGNVNAALKLIISGDPEVSNAKLAITLTPTTVTKANARFSNDADLNYTVVLDDITTASASSAYDSNFTDGLHFADLNAYAKSAETSTGEPKVFQFMKDEKGTTPIFQPGENITVQAVAYSNTALTNIAYSSARATNSLFADPGEVATTAMIANFRHLENLDADISNLDKSLDFTDTEQIADMIWKDEDESTRDFVNAIIEDKSVEKVNIYKISDSTGGGDDCFLPVTPSTWVKGSSITADSVEPTELSYEGNGHAITGVTINGTGDAGLFGTLISGSSVANLKLIDFSVGTSEGNAGALVGKLAQKTSLGDGVFNVSNVVAYNTGNGTDATIKTDSGNAGGLIGQIVGDEAATASDKTAKAVIQKSAAALIVSATGGNAGGLIGTSAGGAVSGCYAGGHTILSGEAVMYSDTAYNVTAIATGTGDDTTGGVAGGLIGDAGATKIENSYSTCSVTGKYVGGFVGKGDGGGSATNCYATGLVLGGDTTTKSVTGDDGTSKEETTFTEIEAQEGAFAYAFGGTTMNCKFFEIINEREEKDAAGALTGGYTYLLPIPKDTTGAIKALDANAEEYNKFCGTDWKPAIPYEDTLETYYGKKYNLETVEQLGATLKGDKDDATEYFVATHYGDWPAPEIFVVNTK